MKPARCTEPEASTTASSAHQSPSAETATHTSLASSPTPITNTRLILMVKSQEKMLWSKKSMLMVQLLVVLLYLKHLNTTLVVFSMTQLEIWKLFTMSQLSASVSKMTLNTGPSETPGVSTGEKTVSSESSEVLTTSTSSLTAHGLSPRTHGLCNKSTLLLKLRKTTH